MDARDIATTFHIDDEPGWACPFCPRGRLGALAKADFVDHETAASEQSRTQSEDYWGPEDMTRRLAGVLRCSSCKELVMVAGSVNLETNPNAGYGDENEEDYVDVFYPHFVNPAPRLLSRPCTMPESVKRHLVRAEELFWIDLSAAVNAIRAALEAVLTDQGIPRVGTLHSRIELFEKTNPLLGKRMLAVKYIGNAGSHEDEEPTREDVYVCLDFMENVLEEVYDERSKRLDEMAERVNTAKGPLSRVRKT